jgi:phage-related protein
MEKFFIAYQGNKFTLEWYYDDLGKSEALEYFNALSLDRRKKADYLFSLLGDSGKLFNKEKFCYEDDQIYALKPSPDRFLCFFFDGKKVIITSAYEKKTKKIPSKEKQRALKVKQDYTKRCMEGTYYEKKSKINS